ncbi:MAG: ABC transporter permease [Planctomycetota bacterium]|nr:ABC transporter permease [Planctomycetota bacterium]MDP6942182.1 ABC transporter permease [Planctomycetota bacterium]
MKRFLRRVAALLCVLFFVHALTFFMVHSVRGGPFDSERQLPPEVEQALLAKYHLDESLPRQYVQALAGVFKGDLGPSLRYRGSQVSDILSEALPISMILGGGALLVALLFGLPAGLWAARRRNQTADRFVLSATSLLMALPNFVLAGAFVAWFSFAWRLLPPAGMGGLTHWVLPCLCLGLPFAAQIARIFRTSTLEALETPSSLAAKARGLDSRLLLRRHIFRTALMPVVAFLGPASAGLLTGSLVMEQVFALPGLGAHFVQAALNRDYTLALGATLLYTLILGVLSLLTDLLLSRLDPRVESFS